MNKIIYTLLTIIGFSFISIDASAKEEIKVMAIKSCGAWITDKNTIENVSNRSWLLGFMSGLAVVSEVDILKKTDYKSIFLWMNKYCNEHPLSNIADGGMRLYAEIVKKEGL